MKKLIVLAGPTAVGKTQLSIDLAKHFSCPIISGDSRQFYKEIGIGTAKPSTEEMDGVKHYFIDSHSIHDPVSAGKFEEEAIPVIEELFKSHDYLILTGGSGLFLKAIYDGLDYFAPIPKDIRKNVNEIFEENGLEFIQNKLKELDPEYYEKVDLHNHSRILRALEVCIHSGEPFSNQRKNIKKERSFSTIKIMLNREREELYDRINRRVHIMMDMGLIEEAKPLVEHKDLKSLQTVGYTEIFDYLEGNISIERAIELIQQNSRRYAKRQLTWFRREEGFEWFHPNEQEKIVEFISNYC